MVDEEPFEGRRRTVIDRRPSTERLRTEVESDVERFLREGRKVETVPFGIGEGADQRVLKVRTKARKKGKAQEVLTRRRRVV